MINSNDSTERDVFWSDTKERHRSSMDRRNLPTVQPRSRGDSWEADRSSGQDGFWDYLRQPVRESWHKHFRYTSITLQYMQIVHTETRVEYDELMDILEKKGGSWCGWDKMKEYDVWNAFKQDTCINISTNLNTIVFGELVYYIKNWYTILSLNDYKKMNDIKEVCEFKRGEMILTSNEVDGEYMDRIFLAYIDWARNPYVCVSRGDEYNFTTWMPFDEYSWKWTKKKPTHSPEEIENAKKLLIEARSGWINISNRMSETDTGFLADNWQATVIIVFTDWDWYNIGWIE